jgi:heptosyltransferase-2
MGALIVKLGATGDVVRTTPLLERLDGPVAWLTSRKNVELLEDIRDDLTIHAWEERDSLAGLDFDLIVNLEDDADVARFATEIKASRRFGAYADFVGSDTEVRYTPDSASWFDLSLISRFGRRGADQLKLENRRSYQELVFEGLGFDFAGERYRLPSTDRSGLEGDVAIAPSAGAVWPNKNWPFYEEIHARLSARGMDVNFLPQRDTILQHLADVRGHRLLVGGDSLPMHLALGSNVPCVALFTCTSPWEIWGYGLLTKIVSPHLAEYFYDRGYSERATKAIDVEDVYAAILSGLESAAPSAADFD